MALATISHFRHLIRTLNCVVSTHGRQSILTVKTAPSSISKTLSSQGKSLIANATLKAARSSVSPPASHSTANGPKRSSRSASRAGPSSSLPASVEHYCVHCGSAALQLKHVTRSFGKGSSLLVIEAIPLWSCLSCGESYFSAQTMHEIERIKALRKSVAVNRSVPVAAFEVADA